MTNWAKVIQAAESENGAKHRHTIMHVKTYKQGKNNASRLFALTVALCFFLVSSYLASSITHHGLNHHHSPQTHTQSWCDWACKAGQAVQSPQFYITYFAHVTAPLLTTLSSQIPHVAYRTLKSRGPPTSLLA